MSINLFYSRLSQVQRLIPPTICSASLAIKTQIIVHISKTVKNNIQVILFHLNLDFGSVRLLGIQSMLRCNMLIATEKEVAGVSNSDELQ